MSVAVDLSVFATDHFDLNFFACVVGPTLGSRPPKKVHPHNTRDYFSTKVFGRHG